MRRVLIIDDEPDIREVAQLSLEVDGRWEVTSAASGLEGVEKAVADPPDVILLDVMMPGLDGIATLDRLRSLAATADIPVVLLTAKVHPSDLSRYRRLPVCGVLAKPFDPLMLAGELRRVLEAGDAPSG